MSFSFSNFRLLPSPFLFVAAWLLILCAATFAGYQQLFSTFSEYDDEGYVMLSLQTFLDGQPLYDETFSQYGPAYYFLQGALHNGLSLPITSEVTRFKTLALWLAISGLSGWYLFRETRSPYLALCGFVAAFLHLDKLPLETGHPQEQCALFVVAVLLAATFLSASNGWKQGLVAVVIGGLCGATVMTKINVGVLLSMAVGSGLLWCSRPSRLRLPLLVVSAVCCLCLPLVLYRDHLLSFETNLLPTVTVLSLAGVLWAVSRKGSLESRQSLVAMRSISLFTATTVGTVVIFAAAALGTGTTPGGLHYGLIGQHTGFAEWFFHAPSLHLPSVLVAAGLLVLATTKFDAWERGRAGLRLAALGLVVWCGGAYLGQSFRPPVHGLQERGGMWLLLSYGLPLMALLVTRTPQVCEPRAASRRVLMFVAVLLPLIIFPTTGTQVSVGTIPLLLGCLIVGHDGLKRWQQRTANGPTVLRTPRVVGGLLCLLLAAMLARDVGTWRYRSTLRPLGLPGTGALRLPVETVHRQRKLAAALERQVGTFVFANHGRNSFYFWTGKRPPTGMNTTFWRILLTADQQEKVVESLENRPHVCVVRELEPRLLPVGPLTRFIDTQFEFAHDVGESELWRLSWVNGSAKRKQRIHHAEAQRCLRPQPKQELALRLHFGKTPSDTRAHENKEGEQKDAKDAKNETSRP